MPCTIVVMAFGFESIIQLLQHQLKSTIRYARNELAAMTYSCLFLEGHLTSANAHHHSRGTVVNVIRVEDFSRVIHYRIKGNAQFFGDFFIALAFGHLV